MDHPPHFAVRTDTALTELTTWKAAARISNCSMQMISPELYRQHVLPRDLRFFDRIGGGRMHYCGITGDVIDDYFRVPNITGLDVDHNHHDFFALCERAPANVVVTSTGPLGIHSPEIKRLLLPGITTLPEWAALLNDGRAIRCSTDLLPWRHKTGERILRLCDLPANDYAGSVMVIRLDFAPHGNDAVAK